MTRRRFPHRRRARRTRRTTRRFPHRRRARRTRRTTRRFRSRRRRAKGERQTTTGEKVPQPKKKGKKEQTVSGDEDNDTPGKKTFAGRREPPVVESRAYHMYCSMRDAFNIIIKPTIQKSSKWQEQFELFGIN